MATFVMIHGAWHGGWCFDPLRPLLEAKGHRLIAPDLPGMGGSDADLAAVTLDGWAEFVANICRTADTPVILCGHSRGGIVISQAAETAPEAINALVYITAMLVPPDISREALKTLNDSNPDFTSIIQRHASGVATTVDPARAPAIFAQLSPMKLSATAAQRLRADPTSPRSANLHLTHARYGSLRRHYIECVYDLTIPIIDQRRMQALQPCASVITLNADHSPFFSVPKDLAAALTTIATQFA